jgi:hypothetical protein
MAICMPRAARAISTTCKTVPLAAATLRHGARQAPVRDRTTGRCDSIPVERAACMQLFEGSGYHPLPR